MLLFKEITTTLNLNIPETVCVERLSTYSKGHFSLLDTRSITGEFISAVPPAFEFSLVNNFIKPYWNNQEKTRLLVLLREQAGQTEVTMRTKTGLYIILLFITWLLLILKIMFELRNGVNLPQWFAAFGFIFLIVFIDRMSKKILIRRVTEALKQ